MLQNRLDPRDTGTPGEKEWQQFRAAFAGAMLNIWLLSELDELAPDYFRGLRERFNYGIAAGEGLAQDDPTYDGAAIIDGPTRYRSSFIDMDEALELEQQLFPHHDSEEEGMRSARALAIIALHSALESYCRDLGIAVRRTSLPRAIRSALANSKPPQVLDSETHDALVFLDETRHILVHNRGIVDDNYINNVPYNRLQRGEVRPVSESDLARFSRVVWKVARLLRSRGPTAE
jgi:hypothetical protein